MIAVGVVVFILICVAICCCCKKRQGKAANQLNALRVASGHVLQVLDANMDFVMLEGLKVPADSVNELPPFQCDKSYGDKRIKTQC